MGYDLQLTVPNYFEDIARGVHGLLSHCETGNLIITVGCILDFMEGYNDWHPLESDAYLMVQGQNPERSELVSIATIGVHERWISFGIGEHFKPGPKMGDLDTVHSEFSFAFGEDVDEHMLSDWCSKFFETIENFTELHGSVKGYGSNVPS